MMPWQMKILQDDDMLREGLTRLHFRPGKPTVGTLDEFIAPVANRGIRNI